MELVGSEPVETVAAIILFGFILIVMGILIDANYPKTLTSASEFSYIASLVSDTKTTAQIKTEDTQIRTQDNTIAVKIDKVVIQRNYFGPEIPITQENDIVIING